MNKILLIGGVLVVVGAVVYFIFVSQNTDIAQTTPVVAPSNEESGMTTMSDKDQEVFSERLGMFMAGPEGQNISLTDLTDMGYLGTAHLLLADSVLKHAVVAQLPIPPEGEVYEGWLVDPTSAEFFSTGVMQSAGDNQFNLYFEKINADPRFRKVVITQETVVDDIPEVHVLEGVFN